MQFGLGVKTLCLLCNPQEFRLPFTRSGGLWHCLVDARVETATDGNVTGGIAGLSSLVPQLLFPPPFRSSV